MNPQAPARSFRPRTRITRGLLPWCMALVLCGLVEAVAAAPSVREIEQSIVDLERTRSDDAARQELVGLYRQARDFAANVVASRDAQTKLEASARKSAETVRALEREARTLSRALGTEPLTAGERELDIAGIEALLDAANSERILTENRLQNYQQRVAEFATRPAAMALQRAELTERIATLESELGDATVPADERDQARKTLHESELAARAAALELLNAEQATLPSRARIADARRSAAMLELDLARQRIAALNNLLLALREEQVRTLEADVVAASSGDTADPAILVLARDNAAISAEMSRLVTEQANAAEARVQDQTRREQLAGDFELARERVAVAGRAVSLGRVLVDQRRALPAPRELARRAGQIDQAVTRAVQRRIEIDDVRRTLTSASQRPVSTPLGSEVASEQHERLRLQQSQLLRTVDSAYQSYLRTLAAAGVELQRLSEITREYTAFLDEHLLWLPNLRPFGPAFVRDLWSSMVWFTSPTSWQAALIELPRAAMREVAALFAVAVLFLASIGLRSALKARLARYAAAVRQRLGDSARNTVVALLSTTMMASTVPLALWWAAILWRGAASGSQLAAALGTACETAAVLALAIIWICEFLRRDGVAIAHFGWTAGLARELRRAVSSFGMVFVPSYTLAQMFEWQGAAFLQSGAGRLGFIIAMIAVTTLGHWLLRDAGTVGREIIGRARTLPGRTRKLWRPAMVLAPLVFAALTAFGYQYTSLELSRYYGETVLLILGAILVHNLALRWLSVAEARLALRRLWSTHDGRGAADPDDTDRVDLATIGTHTRLLLGNAIGWSMALILYWIWRDVLPALNVFERVTLWEIAVQGGDGSSLMQAVTLGSVAFAAIIAGITIIGARNLPGVLEIGVLQRMQVSAGGRYAYTTLAQYLIVAVGISFTLSTLGLRWSQIQWLIAALGVGLGFGLQEIFANFVSGLILLFERPIRVGDTVTIGDVTGKVTRIRIRATTLLDWDNKELVVPNKNFITERFFNWTLTDTVQRQVMFIGVAYGTDPEQVIAIIRTALAANSLILDEPAPAVFFIEFGESALNFRVHAYVREPADLLIMRNELHIALARAFADTGIEIPFPQRDIHVRSMPSGSGPGEVFDGVPDKPC